MSRQQHPGDGPAAPIRAVVFDADGVVITGESFSVALEREYGIPSRRLIPFFVDEFRRKIPGYMLRHKVKAGMTGWAQINGWRGNTSLEKRIEYDLYYIERWSLGFDLKILVRTIWRGFFSKHAY